MRYRRHRRIKRPRPNRRRGGNTTQSSDYRRRPMAGLRRHQGNNTKRGTGGRPSTIKGLFTSQNVRRNILRPMMTTRYRRRRRVRRRRRYGTHQSHYRLKRRGNNMNRRHPRRNRRYTKRGTTFRTLFPRPLMNIPPRTQFVPRNARSNVMRTNRHQARRPSNNDYHRRTRKRTTRPRNGAYRGYYQNANRRYRCPKRRGTIRIPTRSLPGPYHALFTKHVQIGAHAFQRVFPAGRRFHSPLCNSVMTWGTRGQLRGDSHFPRRVQRLRRALMNFRVPRTRYPRTFDHRVRPIQTNDGIDNKGSDAI